MNHSTMETRMMTFPKKGQFNGRRKKTLEARMTITWLTCHQQYCINTKHLMYPYYLLHLLQKYLCLLHYCMPLLTSILQEHLTTMEPMASRNYWLHNRSNRRRYLVKPGKLPGLPGFFWSNQEFHTWEWPRKNYLWNVCHSRLGLAGSFTRHPSR